MSIKFNKTLIAAILFLYGSFFAFGQKISKSDSTKLNAFWIEFSKAIELKDIIKIKNISLQKIDCDLCITTDSRNYEPPKDYMISIDTFIYRNVVDIINSPLWKALKKRGYTLTCRIVSDYEIKNLPKDYEKNLKLYELWIQTYLPNEWAEGHEGQSHAFQFIRYKKSFRFYGLTSVP